MITRYVWCNLFITDVEREKRKHKQNAFVFVSEPRHVVRERRAEESNIGVIPRGLCRASRTSVSEFRYYPAVSAAGAYILVLAGSVMPFTVFAQPESTRVLTFADLAFLLIDILNIVIQIGMASALLVFLWGLAQYVFKAEDENSIQYGKFLMTWGILALFILVSVWGILRFFYGEFNFDLPFGTFLLPT